MKTAGGNIPYSVGSFLGGLVATLIVSRLLLWVTKSWDGGAKRVVLIHSMSLLIAAVLSTFGHADGGPLQPYESTLPYILPQICWLIWDLLTKRTPRLKVQQ